MELSEVSASGRRVRKKLNAQGLPPGFKAKPEEAVGEEGPELANLDFRQLFF